VAHWRVFHENRDEVGGLSSPLVNKFSGHAGERAQMQAERSTRNREVRIGYFRLRVVGIRRGQDLREA
jgi:hypothetical protein